MMSNETTTHPAFEKWKEGKANAYFTKEGVELIGKALQDVTPGAADEKPGSFIALALKVQMGLVNTMNEEISHLTKELVAEREKIATATTAAIFDPVAERKKIEKEVLAEITADFEKQLKEAFGSLPKEEYDFVTELSQQPPNQFVALIGKLLEQRRDIAQLKTAVPQELPEGAFVMQLSAKNLSLLGKHGEELQKLAQSDDPSTVLNFTATEYITSKFA